MKGRIVKQLIHEGVMNEDQILNLVRGLETLASAEDFHARNCGRDRAREAAHDLAEEIYSNLANLLLHRTRRCWKTANGDLVPVSQMSDIHLKNALAAVESGRVNPHADHDCDASEGACAGCDAKADWRDGWINTIHQELKRRSAG